MLNNFLARSQYPYFGFIQEDRPLQVPSFFHVNCPDTGKTLCYCPKATPTGSSVPVLQAMEVDLEEIQKRRMLDRERVQAVSVPRQRMVTPLDTESDQKLCDCCLKSSSNYKRVKQNDRDIFYCKDCADGPDGTAKKAWTLNARKKRMGPFLPKGITQSELGRRGRPRIYCREEDETIHCYFPKCFRRNVRVDKDPDLLECRACRRTFHAKCSDPPLNSSLVKRFPWYCLECKTCAMCGKVKDDTHIFMCEACDRGFHTKCAKITSPSAFYCADCSMCSGCKDQLVPPQEVDNPLFFTNKRVCERCYSRYQAKDYCPVCLTLHKSEVEDMLVQCDVCQLWVHAECTSLPQERWEKLKERAFQCPRCRERQVPKVPS